MAANGASSVKVHMNTRGFITVLTSAVCEWILIFLLFIDAALSYFLTKFASYCKLQTPCLLCSRLDHVLGNQKPEFYRNLLCSSHKSEISSLIYCQIHGKLADGHGMCEGCLLSFATKNKSISEAHRLVGAKLGFDLSGFSFQSPTLNKNLVAGSSGTWPCACCNKLYSSRQHAQRLFQLKSTGSGVTKPNIPLPRLPGRKGLNRRDSLKRMRAKFYGSVTSQRLGSSGFDPLSEVGYTELKITSDSESEVPFSDDDDGSSMVREKNDFKQGISIQHASEILAKSSCDDLAPMKEKHQSVNLGPPLIEPLVQCDIKEYHDVKCSTSDVSIGHGLSELKWHQADQEFNPTELPELLSVNDILPSSNAVEVQTHALPELISFDDFPHSVDIVEAPVGASSNNYLTGLDHAGPSMHAEVSISTNGAGLKSDDGVITSKLDYVDPSMSSKSVVNDVGREAPSSFAQQVVIKDPDKVNYMKPMHSEIPVAQGVDLSFNNTSPRVQGHADEWQIADVSSSNGVKVLQKTDSVDRDESGIESLDGSTVSEIDGESVVDRLKRQVEYDRKCMGSLYKELEEERNASAVAANQAMAMITRLQEEKAALHMEALQYLRMMEEQAEYDVEALEKANDLLAEKEKEMQDLEAELELYRNQYADDSMADNIPADSCNVKGENMMVENTPTSCFKDASGISAKSMTSEAFKDDDKPCDTSISWFKFEDEKIYISQCLKKLERKLHGVLVNGASIRMPNGGYYENVPNGVNNDEEFLYNEGIEIDHLVAENGVSMPKVISISNGSPLCEERCNALVDDNHFVGQENNHTSSEGKKSSIHLRERDLVALENEVSDLNDRLEALEANRDFLEHALHTLQNGKEGLQFIQEITHQLQELRKIGLRQRCQFVP